MVKHLKKKQVGVVVVTYVDSVGERWFLMGRKHQKGIYKPSYLFPGGNIDATDPDNKTGALRELYEETGLELEDSHKSRLKDGKQVPITPFQIKPCRPIYQIDTLDERGMDINVFCADFGVLNPEQVMLLNRKIKAQDDLANVEFVSQRMCDFRKSKINGSPAKRSNMEVMQKLVTAPKLTETPRERPAHTKAKPTAVAPAVIAPAVHFAKGHFEAFRLAYDDNDANTNFIQAKAILDRVNVLNAQGHKKVGITYSANLYQTQQIHQENAQGRQYHITGGNQADVMHNVWQMLQTPKYAHLQKVFQVLPITTCEKTNSNYKSVSDKVITDDLDYIKTFAQHGGVVLGWQNQYSSPSKPFAVGGGIFKLTQHQNSLIQNALINLRKTYPAPTNAAPQQQSPKLQTVANSSHTMFANKANVAARNIHVASDKLATNLKNSDPLSIQQSTPVILRKGNINGTFKLGFTTASEAQRFLDRITKTHNMKNVTYYGSNESYPMDANGNVTQNGAYRYIVRFEVPQDALDYMRAVRVHDCDELYNTILGITQSSQNRMTA